MLSWVSPFKVDNRHGMGKYLGAAVLPDVV